MSEKSKRRSTSSSLESLSSPNVRRTSSQYHLKCIPTIDISSDHSPARNDSFRPTPVKNSGRRSKISPLSINKSLVSDQVDGNKTTPIIESKKDDCVKDNSIIRIIEVPQLSGIKPLINETTANKENTHLLLPTPKISKKELVTTPKISKKDLSPYRIKRSNLIKNLGELFDAVPVDHFMENIREESFNEKSTFCGQLMPVKEDPLEERSDEELTESSSVKYPCDFWKTLTTAQAKRDSLYEGKCSLGSRIVQFCDNIYRGLDSLSSQPTDIASVVQLFLSLSNLRELSRCWLIASATESAISYEETLNKLFKYCEEAVNTTKGSELKTKRAAQKSLERLVFLTGKRLLEVNASLEDSIWGILVEDVQDNLAKGSSTQFSVTLHTLIDQISKSQMNVSSMAHQAFIGNKTESIRSLLETSIELLDELQQVMRKFKIWHEFHNGENTMTKMYDLQFVWHSENFQCLSLIYSLVIDYTKNITKIIDEPGSITELPLLDKILENIKINLSGIQSLLPFSSENEAEGENVSESVKLLNDLEQAIRQSVVLIVKQSNLINTSFICCRGILKKAPTYYSASLELSTQSNEPDLNDENINRRVHFSDSILDTTVADETNEIIDS